MMSACYAIGHTEKNENWKNKVIFFFFKVSFNNEGQGTY